MNYVPLFIKTHYSLLSSLIKVDDLIIFAKKNNINTLSITDTNMFGVMEFYDKCIINNIKPIIGSNINIDNTNIILYAKNYEGYINLCKIVSEKNIGKLTFELINKFKNNLICVLLNDDIDNYKKIHNNFNELYISFSNEKEKYKALSITKNIVYLSEIKCFDESENIYLDYLNLISMGKTINDEYEQTKNKHFHLNVCKEYCETTHDFSNLIKIEFPKFKYSFPKINDENQLDLLNSLARKGLSKRLSGKIPEKYIQRLLMELKVITDMGFENYFLVVYDYIKYAKKNKIIVAPGRGSAVGSLVCYSLGITDIDPLKYNLLFERFLNKDRITLPDIDTDFEYLRRDEVIKYVKDKYGFNNVVNIITFDTLLSKATLRDVGRILNIDPFIIDKITKYIKEKETFVELENNEIFMSLFNSEKLRNYFSVCKKLEGLKRHTSIHAAGVIITDIDITSRIPLYKSGDTILTAYSMEHLEKLGLIKMDFLAIKNLTIIDSVIKSIFNKTGEKINLHDIDMSDSKTLDLFYKVKTEGIFQFESNGMKNFLRKLKISNFNDIVSSIALYRPGPRENIDTFIKRREGREKIEYLHPLLEPILKETYGIIIYQEQIIEILKSVANYTLAEADIIRRAISKKKESIILNEKENFVKRCKQNNIDELKSTELYNLIIKFADYGFNKSHSVAYSYIAFWMGYLKSNYQEYFMSNLLNSVISSEEKTREYLDEAKMLGIEITTPNINSSENNYIISNKKMILPLNIIKKITSDIVEKIIIERNKNKYDDIFDFVKRIYGDKVNKKILENLIYSGSLNTFGYNIKTLINNLENIINYCTLYNNFGEDLKIIPDITIYEEYSKEELMQNELNMFGFYLKNHPVTKYDRANLVTLEEVEKHFDKQITSILYVENIKNILTKKNEKMAFLTLSDEFRKIEGVIFPTEYKNYIFIEKGLLIKINAKVEKRLNKFQLIIKKIEKLK